MLVAYKYDAYSKNGKNGGKIQKFKNLLNKQRKIRQIISAERRHLVGKTRNSNQGKLKFIYLSIWLSTIILSTFSIHICDIHTKPQATYFLKIDSGESASGPIVPSWMC